MCIYNPQIYISMHAEIMKLDVCCNPAFMYLQYQKIQKMALVLESEYMYCNPQVLSAASEQLVISIIRLWLDI